jgi:hypothetical protein
MPSAGKPLGKWKGLQNDILFQMFMWQVVGQVISSIVIPTQRELEHAVNKKGANEELTPAELATAVNRGFKQPSEAQNEARNSGIDESKFKVLTQLAGQAPGAAALAEALRRGIIPEDAGNADGVGFKQGIAQGNIANKWAEVIKKLAVRWPSPADALDALLEGQINDAEARNLYKKFGGDEQFFTMLFNTRGSAPTPTQAAEMANRGIIPWGGRGAKAISFEQAFLEGPWRNKWEPAFRKAAEYYPPPRTIVAMVRSGALTDSQALELLKKQGLNPTLAGAYIKDAHKETTDGTKSLAMSTISALYKDKIVSEDEANGLLQSIGYSKTDAAYILAVDDMVLTEQTMRRVLSKLQTLYVSYKISKETATTTVSRLGIESKQVEQLIALWDMERQANVRVLSQSQVARAFKSEIIGYDTAMAKLGHMGYTKHDAWILLSLEMGTKLENEPSEQT